MDLEDFYTDEVITNDQAADDAIRRIAQIKAETARWERFYKERMAAVKEKNDGYIAYLEEVLERYFITLPKKATKTQESYVLPAGKLIRKQQQPKWTVDDAALLPWVKEHTPELVEVTEKPRWGEVKKLLVKGSYQPIQGPDGSLLYADSEGEIVPGVSSAAQPMKFVVQPLGEQEENDNG